MTAADKRAQSKAEYDAYLPDSPELAQHVIADGPYKVASYTATKSLTYVRNGETQTRTAKRASALSAGVIGKFRLMVFSKSASPIV